MSKPSKLKFQTVRLGGDVTTINFGLWYSSNSTCSLSGYSDSNYAGSLTDRKSTSSTCQFVGHSLVSWFSKKQNCIALSTAEAEYLAVGSACTQLIWMKAQLHDYRLSFSTHSRTKHIDIRHHFIRDLILKKEVELVYITTETQLADIFTKPLHADRFSFLRRELGLLSASDADSLGSV
ncbi:Copia protein [Linum perenne]